MSAWRVACARHSTSAKYSLILGVTGFDGSIANLPTGNLGLEDTLLLKRLLERGPVEVEFSFKNRIRKNVTVNNVVAEIPGTDGSGDYVLIGGHLDSWHPGTGAQDNGTGAATVLAVAQAIQASGLKPKRTIRFVLFGGEEEGTIGSINQRDLNLGAATVGVTAYAFADAGNTLKHYSAKEVEDQLKAVNAYTEYQDMVAHKVL